MEYRGFEIEERSDGWWATTAGGFITLGPFASDDDARIAVDAELGD